MKWLILSVKAMKGYGWDVASLCSSTWQNTVILERWRLPGIWYRISRLTGIPSSKVFTNTNTFGWVKGAVDVDQIEEGYKKDNRTKVAQIWAWEDFSARLVCQRAWNNEYGCENPHSACQVVKSQKSVLYEAEKTLIKSNLKTNGFCKWQKYVCVFFLEQELLK